MAAGSACATVLSNAKTAIQQAPTSHTIRQVSLAPVLLKVSPASSSITSFHLQVQLESSSFVPSFARRIGTQQVHQSQSKRRRRVSLPGQCTTHQSPSLQYIQLRAIRESVIMQAVEGVQTAHETKMSSVTHSAAGLGAKSVLSASQKAQFDADGFVIVRNLLDKDETDILVRTAKSDPAFGQHAHAVGDPDGKKVKMALWNHPTDDVYGTISRLPKVVDTLEHLLGDEVYHYHSKMVIKEPFTGGSFCWHQDYGYWYLNGCLFPDMGSVMIAVDPNTKENGCLQVLRGSHRLGRVEHGRYGEQTGADPERCEQAQKALDLVYCEMAPGDALFFHCNTLHRSQANTSPHPRWSLLCCYNTKHNNPYKESHHPFYEPLDKAADDAVRKYGVRQADAGKKFWHPSEDKTVGAT